ncbi:hypothetical protein TNIN_483631 [Trichonephila inaurata madagascariensis]|uniref:Mos1 transposase HTH domain-containing protein n=1 Tax=Trichonephila inaurata madagascariensis TaxID=2747483 RepID=A0A8X6I4F6_9ARAC|nr:hypothetical protein TNIN_483631 [Trichonephila inaurata madagascariensis]
MGERRHSRKTRKSPIYTIDGKSLQIKRWHCCSACAKRRPASLSFEPRYRYGEKVRFEFVVAEEVRAVICYEWARGVSGTEIHNRLVEVYGPGVMSKQMVREGVAHSVMTSAKWSDILRAGRTRTATKQMQISAT